MRIVGTIKAWFLKPERLIIFSLFSVLLFPLPLGAEEEYPEWVNQVLPDWSLKAQSTLKVEGIENFGDVSASPYKFEKKHIYNDFSLDAKREISLSESFQVQAYGTVNGSDYRSTEKGILLERGTVRWTKGDNGLPFHLEVGDFFGQTTLRTFQRSLKGIQLEVQPDIGLGNTKNSFQFFSGISKNFYRELERSIDMYSGASWLMENDFFGSVIVSVVHNYKKNKEEPVVPVRDQFVQSIAWGNKIELLGQKLETQAEVAYFIGDHGTGASGTNDQEDNGTFVQVKGKSVALPPLSYRFSFEQYGEDFKPAGASVNADQRTLEAHAGWRFPLGHSIQLRAQSFRTSLEQLNSSNREVIGINASGPLFTYGGRNFVGRLNAFSQAVESDDGDTNTHTDSLNASFLLPVIEDWTLRPGFFFNSVENQITNVDKISRQYALNLDYDFKFADFKGSVSPGLVFRHKTGQSNESQEFNPQLSITVRNQKHNFRGSYNNLILNSEVPGAVSSKTANTSFYYSYQLNKAISLGVDGNTFHRDPESGDATDAYRIGGFITFRFGREAVKVKTAAAAPTLLPGRGDSSEIPTLAELAPGMKVKDAEDRLARNGIIKPTKREGLLIYETPFYRDINRRQRLGLVYKGKTLKQSVLIIDFEDFGDLDTLSQVFERVRKVLIDRYGSADLVLEEGEFSADIADDLSSGTFRRIIEWNTKDGRLRFGIPRRTDGQIRMEIIHAKQFPPVTDPYWSLEKLR